MQPFCPLRFYEAVESQNFRRTWVEKTFTTDQHLICSWRNFVPFVLKKALNNGNTVSGALLHNTESGYWTDVYSLVSGDFATLHDTDTGERWHVFKSLLTATWPTEFAATNNGVDFQMAQKAVYFRAPLYLEITDGSETWYSETFRMIDFDEDDLTTCDYTKIEYTSLCRLGDLPYHLLGFGLRAFFDTDVARPRYEYEEEIEESGVRNKSKIFQRVEKRSLLEVVCPEYVADALSLVPLHSFLVVTTRYGEALSVTESEYESSFEADGVLATASLDLLLSYTVKNCC